MASYEPESDDVIPLIEGERMTAIDKTQPNWWYVKKNLSSIEGWVPAAYLMEETEYNDYLAKQIAEIADTLAVEGLFISNDK